MFDHCVGVGLSSERNGVLRERERKKKKKENERRNRFDHVGPSHQQPYIMELGVHVWQWVLVCVVYMERSQKGVGSHVESG